MSNSVPQIPDESIQIDPLASSVAYPVEYQDSIQKGGPFKAANTLASLQPKPSQTYDEPAFATQADQASITPSGPAVQFESAGVKKFEYDSDTNTVTVTDDSDKSAQIEALAKSIVTNPIVVKKLAEQGQCFDKSAINAVFSDMPTGLEDSDLAVEWPAEQLSVDDSFELLFDLVADLSTRLQDLEDRILLHNKRASHRI